MVNTLRRAYGMIGPSFIWFVMFLIIPIALIVVISFTTSEGYGDIIYQFSANAYKEAFNSLYLKVVLQSLLWSLITMVACLVLAYPFAYFIAHAGKWKNSLLLLVMIPFWTNLLIRLYAWVILLNNKGVINNVLLHLDIIKEPIKLMYTPYAVVIGMVYAFLPFMILPIYSSIEQLDKSYLEASEDLGANPIKTFFKVTLPLTFPGILAGCILTFVPAVGVFVVTDLLTGGNLVMIGNIIRDAFMIGVDLQLGAALAILIAILVLVMLLVFMKFTSSRNKNLLI